MLHSNGRLAPADAQKQVLIIEDNPLSLKMLNVIISAQGYQVLEATTGMEGLELARQHHPVVIVTDIRLPDISGFEVVSRLKSEVATSDIAVIGASAHAAADDEATGNAGFDAFIPKPIMIPRFIQILRSLAMREPAATTGSATPIIVNAPQSTG